MNLIRSLFSAGKLAEELAPVTRAVRGVVSAEGQMPKSLVRDFNLLKTELPQATEQANLFQQTAKKATGKDLQPKSFLNIPELAANREAGVRGSQGVSPDIATMLDAIHSDPNVAGSKMQQVRQSPALPDEYKKAIELNNGIWHGTLDKADLANVIPDLLDQATGQTMRESSRFSYEPTTYNLFELKKLNPEARKSLLGDANTPQHIKNALTDIESGAIPREITNTKGSVINTDFLKKKNPNLTSDDIDNLRGVSDPVYSHALRIQQMLQDVAHYKFIDAAKQKGFISDTNPGNFVNLFDTDIVKADAGIAKQIKEGKFGTQLWMDPGLAYEYGDLLKNAGKVPFSSPTGKLHTGWKALMTVWNPKTQLANRMTNGLMMYADHGIVPGDQYTRAAGQILKQRENNPLYNLAKETGLISNSFAQQELGQGMQKALNISKTANTPLEKAGAVAKGIAELPGKAYQGAESEGKMAIFLKSLQKQGVNLQGNQLTIKGRAVDMTKPFQADADLFNAGQTAAEAANGTLFDYGNQSRLVKTLRSVPGGIPFITFYANFYPTVARMALGRTITGQFDPMVALRFWSIPGSLYALNELGKAYTGTTAEQDKVNRDALPEAYRSPAFPWENPRMPFNVDASGNPVSADTAGSKPSYLPMGNVVPFDPTTSKTGVLGLPSVLMPFQDPLSSTAILAMTGKQPYQQKELIGKNSPDKAALLGQELLKLYMPNVLKQSLPGGRFNSAVQGIPPSQFEPRQSVGMAAANLLSPFRPVGVDTGTANMWKGKEYKNAVNDWKYGIAKELRNLALRAGKLSPEQMRTEQQKIVAKYMRTQQEWMKNQYPNTYKPPKGG